MDLFYQKLYSVWNNFTLVLIYCYTSKITETVYKHHYNITEIMLKVALNTISYNPNPVNRKTDNTMAKRTKYKRTNNDLQNIHIKLKIE
jgi:hypothetical protein